MPSEGSPNDEKPIPETDTPVARIQKAREIATAIEKTGEGISLAGKLEVLTRYAKKYTKDPEAEKIGLFLQQFEGATGKKISKAKREAFLETYTKDAGALLSEIEDKIGPEQYKKLLEGEQEKEAKERGKLFEGEAWQQLINAAGPLTRRAVEAARVAGGKVWERVKPKAEELMESGVLKAQELGERGMEKIKDRYKLWERDKKIAESQRDIETCERDIANADERIRKERDGIARNEEAVKIVSDVEDRVSKKMLDQIERERAAAEVRITAIEQEREFMQARLAGLRETHSTWEQARDAIAQKFIDRIETPIEGDRITAAEIKLKQKERLKKIESAEQWVKAYELDIQQREAEMARNAKTRIDFEPRVAQEKNNIIEYKRLLSKYKQAYDADQRRLDTAEARIRKAEDKEDKYMSKEKRRSREDSRIFNNIDYIKRWNASVKDKNPELVVPPHEFIKFTEGETELPLGKLQESLNGYFTSQKMKNKGLITSFMNLLKTKFYGRRS